MTVKILSGGAAALTVPDSKPDTEPDNKPDNAAYAPILPDINVDNADSIDDIKPVTVVEREYEYEAPKARHRRGRGIGFGTVLLIQLIACGLLFSAAWAALSLAPAETADALREVICRFTGASA